MLPFIVCLILGCFIIVMGAVNMTGNLSTLHSYHRHRVAEKDRKPFGRLVGLGTVLVGAAVAIYGVCLFIYEKTQSELAIWIGVPLLIVGIVVGLTVSFYAMIKYNKGIF